MFNFSSLYFVWGLTIFKSIQDMIYDFTSRLIEYMYAAAAAYET